MAIFEKAFDEGTERLEQFDQAISKWNKVLETDPGNADAYYNRGVAYRKKGELEQAMSDYTKAMEIDPPMFGPT